jgi:hypothetical protein
MAQGKVGLNFPLEPAQPGDSCCRDALAPRPPATLIHHRRHPVVLDRSAKPAHLPRRDPDDIRRRYQLSCPLMALRITSRRVIARASRHTCRSMFSIVRHYRSRRTSLNVYDPDISYVYDKQCLNP